MAEYTKCKSLRPKIRRTANLAAERSRSCPAPYFRFVPTLTEVRVRALVPQTTAEEAEAPASTGGALRRLKHHRPLLPGLARLEAPRRALTFVLSWLINRLAVGTQRRIPILAILCQQEQRQCPCPSIALSAENARLIHPNTAMARYLHPRLAGELMHTGETAPRVRSMLATILFVDIRGFSELAEQFGPLSTAHLLDKFFSIIVACVEGHRGTVDKFIGDGVMATFGIPIATDDDADRAVEAACAMLGDVDTWNRARREAGDPEIHIGIGIDTDVVVAGTIGGPTRSDYTVIGDGVNTAARLQQASESHGAALLISARSYSRLIREHPLTSVGMIDVGRRSGRVAAHRILSSAADNERGSASVSSADATV